MGPVDGEVVSSTATTLSTMRSEIGENELLLLPFKLEETRSTASKAPDDHAMLKAGTGL